MKRCLTALNFVYNILETDFAFWLESKELKNFSSNEQNRPLLTILLWPDKRNMGECKCLTSNCFKVLGTLIIKYLFN